MKKLLSTLLLVLVTLSLHAAYYVAGNGTTGNPWCDGKSWQPAGSLMTLDSVSQTYTVTFVAVPVGSYQFKVTTGSWSTSYGFSALNTSASNLYATSNGDGNVCFDIQLAQDITIAFKSNKITLTGSIGNEHPDPALEDSVGTIENYGGVMLQAFYWDSNSKTKYSLTKYATLQDLADQYGKTFDMIWLPPSGNGGGVGYYTKTYSNLNSAWGTSSQLTSLLNYLRNRWHMKVLADVVINHRQSSSGWAKGFTSENFGAYGTWQMTSEHICSTDEAATSTSSDSRGLTYGNADTGDNDGGCRDLDHSNPWVQNFCMAYEDWLLNEVHFDGFRYDMTKGYLGSYLSQYNLHSQPYFSVSEFYDTSVSNLKNHLAATQHNTAAFDFAFKYNVMNAGLGKGLYTYLKTSSNKAVAFTDGKHAVTFIDNHDTFERSDNQNGEFIKYLADLSDSTVRAQILEANAYMLMMPGVPCVFWPHWYKYQNDIDSLVAIRKEAGIHCQSTVSNEAAANGTSGYYVGTIHGTNHDVILVLAPALNYPIQVQHVVPAGATLRLQGDRYAIYYAAPTAVEEHRDAPRARKTMHGGKILIENAHGTFNTLGQKIK